MSVVKVTSDVISDKDKEYLDWKIEGYDEAGLPAAGISNHLKSDGKELSPPASDEAINDYIDEKNKSRSTHLPHVS